MLAYDYGILSMITLEEVIGIALFKVKMMGNISRHSHKNYSDFFALYSCYAKSLDFQQYPNPARKLSRNGRWKFDYIPISHRLCLWYANLDQAKELKVYKKTLFEKTESEASLRDFWDRKLYKSLLSKGMFIDIRDVSFYFSTDGVNLFRKGMSFFSLFSI